jgi:ribosomal protein S18 acetylase RimI-like enzyme
MCRPDQIIAIPNGIAEFSQNTVAGVSELRRQMGAGYGDLLVLSISRLAADKGLEYLIEAAAMLPRTGRRIQVAIAGDGPVRDRLEQLAVKLDVADRVTFLGFREDVADLLAASDLVVLPSLREGLSISLLEAMAVGKPIVASSIGSQREVASHAEMACLTPPADSLALSEAILRLAGDPALMVRLGTNARAVYETRYTETRMLESYRQLYHDLLSAKCPKAVTAPQRSTLDLRPLRPSRTGGRSGLVRQATANDLPGIVNIHQKAFSQFFLTRLGDEFLRKYYGLVLNYRAGILLVSEGTGVLEGFACGFVDPAEFYQSMWGARRAFTLPVLSALVRDPSLATKVLSGVQRIQTPASEWPERSCELSSIAVEPETSGSGLGKTLMRAFLEQARSMDAQCVYLTTDADGNDAVNAFYRDVGFQHTRRFLQRKGRWMNEYVINGREAGTRCEARP